MKPDDQTAVGLGLEDLTRMPLFLGNAAGGFPSETEDDVVTAIATNRSKTPV
jgi:hypothetical protein